MKIDSDRKTNLNDLISRVERLKNHNVNLKGAVEELPPLLFDIVKFYEKFDSSEVDALNKIIQFILLNEKGFMLHRIMLSDYFQNNNEVFVKFKRLFLNEIFKLAGKMDFPTESILSLLLIVRSVIDDGVIDEKISFWHKKVIPDLDFEVSSLLYQTMFSRRKKAFNKNVMELQSILIEIDWVNQWERFGYKKVFMYLCFFPSLKNTNQLSLLRDYLISKYGDTASYENHGLVMFLDGLIGNQLNPIQLDPSFKFNNRFYSIKTKLLKIRPFFLNRKARKLKIAVLVSGQLRGYKKVADKWKKICFSDVECDYYVHTWGEIGLCGTQPFRANLPFDGEAFNTAYRFYGNKVGYKELLKRYPEFYNTINEYGEVDYSDLGEVYGTDQIVIESSSDDKFNGWSNQQKMYYKICQAQALLDSSGKEYDLVVRIRPDKEIKEFNGFWPDIYDLLKGSNMVLADLGYGVHLGELMMGDQFAVGTHQTMKSYSSTYYNAIQLVDNGQFSLKSDLKEHTALAMNCLVHNIKVGRFPAKFGGLSAAENLTSEFIKQLLEKDSQGRMDEIDKALIESAEMDIHANLKIR